MMYAKLEGNKIKKHYQLPRVYNNILNFKNASKEILEFNGFYELLEPTFDKINQKLGSIIFDDVNKIYTYEVVDLTQIEIDAYNKQKNRELIAEFNSVKKADGLEYFIEIDNRITELMQGKNESEIKVLDKQLRAKITSIIVLIKDGQWFTARDYINNRSLPTIPEVKALFLEVREKARNYVNENYNI